MVRPALRSRSFRRVKRKAPGGRVVLHFKPRKPTKHTCKNCKKVLAGVPNMMNSKFRSVSISQKRPTRPYGGNLCGNCMRVVMKAKARE